MNSSGKRRHSRTMFAMAVGLLCAMFGLSAMAQDVPEKPMEAKARAALVKELKGVVERSTPDEKEAAQVAERWDRRTDLDGKSKREVINLLFTDVKAVVKDAGVRYQIYSIFSFYKQIPDENFNKQTPDDTQPTAPPPGANSYEEPWHPAARFAAQEGGKKEKATITLLRVESADIQTDEEGLTYQICMAVNVKKGSTQAVKQYARTTVFRNDETMLYSLKSWALFKTPPPGCRKRE